MTNSRSTTASWRGSLKVVVSNHLSWTGPLILERKPAMFLREVAAAWDRPRPKLNPNVIIARHHSPWL
jgi:hypothetical protein